MLHFFYKGQLKKRNPLQWANERKGVQSPYLYPFRALLGVGRPTADVGLTGLLTPKDPTAIRQDEANKYCAVFLEELPNGLPIAGLNSNGRR